MDAVAFVLRRRRGSVVAAAGPTSRPARMSSLTECIAVIILVLMHISQVNMSNL
jgi:hypothetical protein